MTRFSTILILTLAISGLVLAADSPTQNLAPISDNPAANNDPNRTASEKPPSLRDGFLFAGVEGTIARLPGKDTWGFIPQTDVTDSRATVKAGQTLELLPSAGLERITAHAGENLPISIRLWARVTKYTGKNYLFVAHFIPTRQARDAQPQTEDNNDRKTDRRTADDPNEAPIIPADVMAILKPKQVVDLVKMTKVLETKRDVMLVDRTGFVTDAGDKKTFRIDGLGRNVENISFKLLPCEVLQWTEYNLRQTPGRQRYRIAAIVTKYKDQYYMLLQRAVRTYHHGNFAR